MYKDVIDRIERATKTERLKIEHEITSVVDIKWV